MKTPLEQALPIVAASYGRKFGVKVVISGDDAYTDGSTIVVPNIDLSSKSELFKDALWGFLTHEAAHVRLTDFNCQFVNRVKQHMLNILEDGRIEDYFMQKYPGTVSTLNATADYVFSQSEQQPDIENEAAALTQFLLGWVRYLFLKQEAAKAVYEGGVKAFKEVFSDGAYIQAQAILPSLAKCETTHDCKNLVEQLVSKIEEEEKKEQEREQQQQEKNQDNQGGDDSQQSQGGGDDDSGDGDSQGDSSCDGTDDAFASDGSQGAESNDASGSTDGTQKSNGAGGDDSNQPTAMDKALSASEDDLPGDYLDAFKDEANGSPRDASLSIGRGSLDVNPGQVSGGKLSDETVINAKLAANRIKKELAGMLQAQQRVKRTPKRVGKKLNTKSLSRLSVGDTRIFLRDGERKKVDTAVNLLVDLSSSMNGGNDLVAVESALALAFALDSINGVTLGVNYFGPGNVNNVLPLGGSLRANQSRFGQRSAGGTPAAEAVWAGCYQLVTQKADRKVVVMITDGEPNDGPALQKIIQKAEASGIEFIGIGIGSPAVKRFIANSIVIKGVKDLSGTLFTQIKQSLLAA